MAKARNSVHSRMNAPGRTTRGFRFALLLRSSPPSRIPNEARSKDGADEPVNNKLAVPIHGRVAGPGKQQRSLAEPMQADQDKERADDHGQDLHGTPFANLAERRQSSAFDTISRYSAALHQRCTARRRRALRWRQSGGLTGLLRLGVLLVEHRVPAGDL